MYATDFRNCTIMHRFLLSDTHIGFLSSETAILSQNRTVRSDSGPVCLTGRLSVDQREFRRRGTQCTKTLWPLVWERTVCYWNDTPHTAQLNVKRITHTHTHRRDKNIHIYTKYEWCLSCLTSWRWCGWPDRYDKTLTFSRVSSFLLWLIIKKKNPLCQESHF